MAPTFRGQLWVTRRTRRPTSRACRRRRPRGAGRGPGRPRVPPGCRSETSAVRSRSSSRLRMIRARSTSAIDPLSSLTTTTTASVCSVMPRAARWRVPSRSLCRVVSARGSTMPAATISAPRMRTAPSCRAARGAKTVRNSSAERSAWSITPVSAASSSPVSRSRAMSAPPRPAGGGGGVEHPRGLGGVLASRLASEDDERSAPLGGEERGGVRDLGRDALNLAVRARPEPAQRADPADTLEGSAQLWLEDDDEREEADDGTRLEDLREELEAERLGGDVDGVEGDDTDHEPHRARAADQAEEPVDEDSRDGDVDDRDRLDLEARERVQDAVHRRAIVAAAPSPTPRDTRPRRSVAGGGSEIGETRLVGQVAPDQLGRRGAPGPVAIDLQQAVEEEELLDGALVPAASEVEARQLDVQGRRTRQDLESALAGIEG